MILIKRLTIIIEKNQIKKVFYPIFPSNSDSKLVLQWLQENKK